MAKTKVLDVREIPAAIKFVASVTPNIGVLCATMADDRVVSEIVTKFFLNTCQLCQRLNENSVRAMSECVIISTKRPFDKNEVDFIPLTTGSVAEFRILPKFTCVGDVDIMFHRSDQLAIAAGTEPPTQLPADFRNRVSVYEVIDTELPGYVYLISSYILTECNDDGRYKAVQCRRACGHFDAAAGSRNELHGPAIITHYSGDTPRHFRRIAGSAHFTDLVPCVRCLSWPSQAADWPVRHRNYCWPDSATVDCVKRNGCDVVNIAHRRYKQDDWMRKHQWRLSFSRAEIVLLTSWMPVQQIIYHMLRIFVKTERLTDSAKCGRVH